MKVENIHKRIINLPKAEVIALLKTLTTKDDKVWPKKNWPAMRFRNGLNVGETGGHGMISYSVEAYDVEAFIIFKFLKPKGFNGIHKFEIEEINTCATEVKHSIIMETTGFATIKWVVAIRWLHDALIENAFDTIENNVLGVNKFTKWNIWVSILRYILK